MKSLERVQAIAHKPTILDALSALYDPNQVVEIRTINTGGRKRIDCGYFDFQHREKLADIAIKANDDAQVYVCMNPVDPALHSRYFNRMESYAKRTATDKDILSRRWLLIDCDPVRPTGTSSTDEQLQAAKDVAENIRDKLCSRGFPDPIIAMSGNGYHLLYKVGLPNDDDSKRLIERFLVWLDETFSTPEVSVDRTVFNAVRIIKLYGTVARKGDDTPTAPHRLSYLEHVPKPVSIVPRELIEACIPPQVTTRPQQIAAAGAFDLDAFLDHLGIPYEHDIHNGGDRFKLDHCPFNPDHGRGEAAIFRHTDGSLGFKCQHDSCSDKHWIDLRRLVDGPRATRHSPPIQADDGQPINAREKLANLAVLKDYCDSIGHETWLFENLVIKNQILTIIATSGGGKTTVFFFFIVPYMIEQHGCTVYYLDCDSPASDHKRMLAHSEQYQGKFLWLNPLTHGKEPESLLEILREIVSKAERLDDAVFIFDTLKKFLDLLDKRSVKPFYSLMRQLTSLGATIILLGHANKHRVNGLLVFEGVGDVRSDTDALLFFEAMHNSDRSVDITTIVDQAKGAKVRGLYEPISFHIGPDRTVTRNKEIAEIPDYTQKETIREDSLTSRVLRSLKDIGGSGTLSQVHDAVGSDIVIHSVRTAIYRLRQKEKIKFDRGVYYLNHMNQVNHEYYESSESSESSEPFESDVFTGSESSESLSGSSKKPYNSVGYKERFNDSFDSLHSSESTEISLSDTGGLMRVDIEGAEVLDEEI
jgi:ribosomal protein L23